ncbi:class I SAM-dependent methyltransferase [Alphaproteobacteria bacterium]|nr:class I SAM-dependent methyltransferase [Alphaproteobacteria bacterium]
MSRLDSVIRRLTSQKLALEWAADIIRHLDGAVLELGLGNGRTYDHLREILPDRDIYVFEREIAAHPDCIPEKRFQYLGDFRDSLPFAYQVMGANSVLAHLDIGTGEKQESMRLAEQVAPTVLDLMKDGAIIISDQEVENWSYMIIQPPLSIPRGRIFIYQVTKNKA